MDLEVDLVAVEYYLIELSTIIEQTATQLGSVIDFIDLTNDAVLVKHLYTKTFIQKLKGCEEFGVDAVKLLACVSSTVALIDELETRVTTLQSVVHYLKKMCDLF
ncbi:hypothetical protein TELCIR_10602 [Teladorsagia circumcincta]|uniref:Uncharacterized protein n=1 Tax=Teladorsagia circumcincta TaxID=45464 RepID=A0A2G9UDT3_TELCI|nr:hypothetical protein TELCIR_10602 [Teladorsagia circumcincta]